MAHHHSHSHHINHHKHPSITKSKTHQQHAVNLLQTPPPSFEKKEDEAVWIKTQQKLYRNQLEESVKFNPYNNQARNLLAKSLARTQVRTLMEEAKHHAKIVIKNDPTSGEAYYSQGLALMTEHPRKAISAFDKALLYNSPHRGMIHVSRDKAKANVIRKERDFVSTKIRDNTSLNIKNRFEIKSKRTEINILITETNDLLQEIEDEKINEETIELIEPHDGRHGMLPVGRWQGLCNSLPGGETVSMYYENGQYEYECEKMLINARRCLQRRLMQEDVEAKLKRRQEEEELKNRLNNSKLNKKSKRRGNKKKNSKKKTILPVMNFIAIDLDDTVFNSYYYMKELHFKGELPYTNCEYLMQSPNSVVGNNSIIDFITWINETQGIHCLLFTERPMYSKEKTIEALEYLGVNNYEDILWCSSSKIHELATSTAVSTGTVAVSEKKEKKEEDANVDHHPLHFRYAGKTLFSTKQKALHIFNADKSNNVQRKIIAIVGDQDSDFPKDTTDTETTEVKPLCIKIPNYLYTVE